MRKLLQLRFTFILVPAIILLLVFLFCLHKFISLLANGIFFRIK